MSLIIYIFKDLLTEDRNRFVLTVLAVAWGTASIAVMLALGEGVRLTLDRAMQGVGDGILVVRPGQTSQAYKGLPEGMKIHLKPGDFAALRESMPQLGAASGEFIVPYTQMRYGDNWRTGRIVGVEPEYGAMRYIEPEPGGRFINYMDNKLRRRVVVLGPEVAREVFGAGTSPVGKSMEIDGRPFLVIGVMRPKFQLVAYYAYDRENTWIPSETFRSIYDHENYFSLVVQPDVLAQMEDVKTKMREIIAKRKGADPQDEDILDYLDIYEMQLGTRILAYGLQVFLGFMGGVTLLVAGIGIANIMYISVANSTREIGIRMAVGARDHHILTQYSNPTSFKR